MNYKSCEIKEGIKLHVINTDKFKTNLLSVFLTIPLSKETVTPYALIPMVLRRGSKGMPTQEEISKNLENMYGATFDCGIDKIGDNQILKFYFESINNEFLPESENLLLESIQKILEIVFNPLLEEGSFKKEYVESEKNNLKQIIDGKIDNKATYALDRCIEEMYKDKAYGLYKYGYVEDLQKIDNKNLYKAYLNLINTCKIDIFISGKIENSLKEVINNNENIKKLKERKPDYSTNKKSKQKSQIKEIEEKMAVTQGKLIMGLDVVEENNEDKYTTLLYNAILGGTATSKLFQNVREKNSLAYTASSSYIRQKANIFIKCGIEIENYQSAVDIIKEQLEDMKNGKFSEDELSTARKSIISTIKFIPDEQDTEITYYLGQELSGYCMSYEEYINKINNVTKQNIIDIANKISINTIYFLKN